MAKNSDILDVTEAALYLKISDQTLRRLARNGEVPAFKVGGGWRFKKDGLAKWVEAQYGASKALHVMVIDDEQSILTLVREILIGEGFTVDTALGGKEALERMELKKPNLVFLDLKMPEMDGPATLEKIRMQYGQIPVIILTAYPESGLMTRAMQFSPVMLLAKPTYPKKIVEAARSALGVNLQSP